MTVNTICLKDTGYGNISNAGTRFTTVANSGNELALSAATASYSRAGNMSSEPNPGSSSMSEVSKGSVSNPIISINGVARRDNTTEMDNLAIIDAMQTSDGVKLLYYNSTTDSYRDLTDSLGSTDDVHNQASPDTDNGEIASSIKHFHGFVRNFVVKQGGSSKVLNWSFEFVTTA